MISMTTAASLPSAPVTRSSGIFADLEALRLSKASYKPPEKEILSSAPVRRPNKQEFIRVCPDERFMLTTLVFEDKTDRGEVYFVDPAMRQYVADNLVPVLLVTAKNVQEVLFIWPVKLSLDAENLNDWHETGRQAAELAKTKWIRLSADLNLGAYRIFEAEGDLEEPTWPDKTFGELLEVAFRGKVIDNENHPIIRNLRGRK